MQRMLSEPLPSIYVLDCSVDKRRYPEEFVVFVLTSLLALKATDINAVNNRGLSALDIAAMSSIEYVRLSLHIKLQLDYRLRLGLRKKFEKRVFMIIYQEFRISGTLCNSNKRHEAF